MVFDIRGGRLEGRVTMDVTVSPRVRFFSSGKSLVRERDILVSRSLGHKRVAFALKRTELVGKDGFETIGEGL